jgi:hypothetical protein
LVGGFGFFDSRIVFVQAGIGLRGTPHVAKDGAYGGDDGCEQRDFVGETVAVPLGCVFEFVVVGAVDVEAVVGHGSFLS